MFIFFVKGELDKLLESASKNLFHVQEFFVNISMLYILYHNVIYTISYI